MNEHFELERAVERYIRRKRERAWTWAIGGLFLGVILSFFGITIFLGWTLK